MEQARRDHGPIGTAGYMAPEQCDPDRAGEIGPPADIWGLGATVHELAAGRRAFPEPGPPGASLHERYPQLAADPSPLPAGTPAHLATALRACLEPQPGDQPAAAELAAELEPIVDALPRPRLGMFRPGARRRFRRLG